MSESHYELALEHPPARSEVNSKASVSSRRSSIRSTCRICLSSILDPASLACGHRFCERCLEKYWDARDRPEFIVCPLCRTYAFNVDFTQKEAPPSTADFRKTFHALEDISESEESREPSLTCFKLSILVPVVYYILKWLRYPLIELIHFIQVRLNGSL